MDKKTNKRSSSNYNTINAEIFKRSIDEVPKWALAFSAVVLLMSFSVRQIGLDIATPINRILSAYAERVELKAKHLSEERTCSTTLTELQEKVLQLTDQLDDIKLHLEESKTESHSKSNKI